jgi:predicted phage terminase large subunit-like protein
MNDTLPILDNNVLIKETLSNKKDRAFKALLTPMQIRREINNRSLHKFLIYFWPVISNQAYQDNWHVEILCKELEEIAYRVGNRQPKLHDLIINIPPGTTKTIICSIVFPVWCWTKWYWMRFITVSYSSALSLESAEYSRDLVKSEQFKAVYPELDIKLDKDTKSNFKVVKKEIGRIGFMPRQLNGGNRYSTSVGGTLTGFHADILIWDDPLNPQEAVSAKELENTNRWIDQTLPTRKTDKRISTTIGIMQRLNQDDPTGHILAKKKKNVRHICLPGEIENYKEQVYPPELAKYYVNNLLDPGRMDWGVLKDLEADLGQYGYAGQIGQNPTPPGGAMFQVDHFQIIDHLPASVNTQSVARYWDKAGSQGKGCFTAGVKIMKLFTGKYIVLDCKRGQWGTHERERIIRETAEADGQEVTQYLEQEGGSGGKESAESTVINLAGYVCLLDHPTGDKVFRADPFSVQVNNGNVMLLRGDWNKDFIDEYRFFPFGKLKDQVDAGSACFNKLAGKRLAGRVT